MEKPPTRSEPNPPARKNQPPTDFSEARTVPPEKARPAFRDKSATAAPASVPGYELLGELGRGGMGVVYKARQIKLNRFVALKMVLAGSHASAQDMARFRAEAEAIARLQHPNIVQVFEVGEHQGLPFFSMELVTGQNLAQRIAHKPLSLARAVRLVEVLARAVHEAHRAGIIHRDLKPANILMARDGSPKITDFGLAKQLDAAVVQTQSGAIMGTPAYMAPEQAESKGAKIGPATDVYALGAILYELITGQPPFQGPTPLDTILQVLSQQPVPPSRFDPDISLDLETICLKCLHKDPRQRYAKARDLAEDLRRCQDDEPIRARPISTMERLSRWSQRRVKTILLTAALVLALAGIGYFAIQVRLAQGEAARAKQALAGQAEEERRTRENGEQRIREMEIKTKRMEEKHQKELDVEKQRTRAAQDEGIKEKQRGDEATATLERLNAQAKERDLIGKGDLKDFTNKLGMKFVRVPKGTFWMGGGDGKPGDKQVEIKESFYLGATAVTQGQWKALMDNNPSFFCRKGLSYRRVKDVSDQDLDQFPVENVDWDDAQDFLKTLNANEIRPGWLYRLPTEAEWEFACRGGATSKEDCSFNYYLSNPTNDLSSKDANFNGNFPGGNGLFKGQNLGRPCKVGSYSPNQLGLYDMQGNVFQWCDDKLEGGYRVFRGGSWNSQVRFCRAADRQIYSPKFKQSHVGLRLALVPSTGKGK